MMGARRRLGKKIASRLPTRDGMAGNRWLAPIAHRFLSPELWRFTRRSVPRGVALGMFAAFIVPIGQVFLAAFLALPARANVPLAALVTFVTNPFTLPFWLMVANRTGRFFLHVDSGDAAIRLSRDFANGHWRDLGSLFQVAGETAAGFVLLAILGAAVGYLAAGIVWRAVVGRKVRARRRRQGPARDAA